MNGLCPACRRPYDEKHVRWKQLTQEECVSPLASTLYLKANNITRIKSHQDSIAQQAKKKAAAKQKEAAKREADSLSRKHLAGIRVRQKNLVYVTGMRPTSTADHLSEILRRDEYFGQYGKIVKIVVSKAKDTNIPNPAVGVYVTFETKEAAAKCIQAIDGTHNYDSRLRAQYGTTKYCSAYLRGDTCGKKDCMFLHEPGDENESFSRQDLSSMNVISTQSPSQANMPGSAQHPPQPQPPPQQSSRPIAAAAQAPNDDNHSQADSNDGSGLPASASWASKPVPSRKTSHQPVTLAPISKTSTETKDSKSKSESASDTSSRQVSRVPSAQPTKTPPPSLPKKKSLLREFAEGLTDEWIFAFDNDSLDDDQRDLLNMIPPLIDPCGGARRKVTPKQRIEQSTQDTDSQVVTQALSAIDPDENPASGSLQLGGEPEETADLRQRQAAIRPPSLDNVTSPVFGIEHTLSPPTNPAATARGMTPAQQQHLLLQSFKSGSPSYLNQGHPSSGSGHTRQASRFSFANESTASANVKPVANQKLLSQQNSMLPSGTPHNPLTHQQSNSQMFSSGVQGPPPGLKATGTPPVSGGGMFGQGHGFATAGLNYGVNASGRNANDDMMRELMRNRGGSAGNGPASDASRRKFI